MHAITCFFATIGVWIWTVAGWWLVGAIGWAAAMALILTWRRR